MTLALARVISINMHKIRYYNYVKLNHSPACNLIGGLRILVERRRGIDCVPCMGDFEEAAGSAADDQLGD